MTPYENKEPVKDIQDALILLGVYTLDPDPDDCRSEVRLLLTSALEQPEFKELSVGREETEKRIHYYINEMKTGDQVQEIVEQAVSLILPNMKQRVCEWIADIADRVGLAEAKRRNADAMTAKLGCRSVEAGRIDMDR